MANRCAICGKGTTFGLKYARRGAARRSGGSGQKISGKTNRTFRPNLQRLRAIVGGGTKRIAACTSCIKAGKVRKAPRSPNKLHAAESAAAAPRT